MTSTTQDLIWPPLRPKELRKSTSKQSSKSIFFDGTPETVLDDFYKDTFEHTICFLKAGLGFIEQSEIRKQLDPSIIEARKSTWPELIRNSRKLHLEVVGLAVGCELLIKGLLLEKEYVIHKTKGKKEPFLIKDTKIDSLSENTYSLGDLISMDFLKLIELPCDENKLMELKSYLIMLNKDRNDIVHFAYDESGHYHHKIKKLLEFINVLVERTQKVRKSMFWTWQNRDVKKECVY